MIEVVPKQNCYEFRPIEMNLLGTYIIKVVTIIYSLLQDIERQMSKEHFESKFYLQIRDNKRSDG
jgi:hypothetical protein